MFPRQYSIPNSICDHISGHTHTHTHTQERERKEVKVFWDTNAVFFNGSIGFWVQSTDGVRQGCLLPNTLFNIFLERIMT